MRGENGAESGEETGEEESDTSTSIGCESLVTSIVLESHAVTTSVVVSSS